MACKHEFHNSLGIADYDVCDNCGTYRSRRAHDPKGFYEESYWSVGRSTMCEQVWNVDMDTVNGISKNRFVLDRIEVGRKLAIDIGCAPGRLLFWLKWAARFANVVGVDPGDPEEIRRIGAHDGVLLHGFFPEATAPVDTATVDYISALDVFEHVFEPEAFLLECWRLLKRGGQLFLMLPLSDGMPRDSRFFNAAEHVYLHSRANLVSLVGARFGNIKVDRWALGHDTISARKP